jgi:hypothetical protein
MAPLTGYFDLSIALPSYDVVAACSVFEMHRRARGENSSLHAVVLPGPDRGFRAGKLWPYSQELREHMRDTVVIPMLQMMGATSVEFADKRPGQPVPDSIGFGQFFLTSAHVEALTAGCRPLRVPLTPRRNDKRVTITLREAEHWPTRNSTMAEWLVAAIEIRRRGYDVVIVRDTLQAGSRFGDFPCSPQASTDLEARGRLYASSACNLFVNNGPAWFSIALDAPTLIVKLAVENANRCASAAYCRRAGLIPGEQIPNSPSHQRLVWDDDRADVILNAFDAFMSANYQTGAAPCI